VDALKKGIEIGLVSIEVAIGLGKERKRNIRPLLAAKGANSELAVRVMADSARPALYGLSGSMGAREESHHPAQKE
jgi:hypothetical protein